MASRRALTQLATRASDVRLNALAPQSNAVCLGSISSSAPKALSAAYGLRPAFWPQGQFPSNHTPTKPLKRASFASRFARPT
jgi:hypothetical protein